MFILGMISIKADLWKLSIDKGWFVKGVGYQLLSEIPKNLCLK